ncbi:3-isopropylmalate dehydratase large subunit [Ignicoccus islandicus DSM 13165]|uniref:3-isopropylmalate dehydratase large subunit n=1 Tax=Ignicoccus islandicus DSM 13165 TaxID=940295 RepID=A0A0U3F2C8_9CREN|nr:3-isopropylmalate dehydratase large subunit [Ignicoccus islandicus]ALU11701.1 3-isopropylmalate dehydratase large subunit [Ignicoccus islandicus DSM 13165]
MPKTIAEKILSAKAGKDVSPGEIVVVELDAVMAQDGTAPLAIKVMNEKFGGERVKDPSKVVLVIDHTAPSNNPGTSELHILMRKFARRHGCRLFDVGNGICHQLMVEYGYAYPGAVVVGADSHTVTYGALGAFSTGVGSTDAAIAMMTGKLWFKVPEALKFNLTGKFKEAVMSKDLILTIIGELGEDGATYMSAEFVGDGLKDMRIDSRLTVSNMVVEMGAKVGLMPADEEVMRFVEGRARGTPKPELTYPDKGAHYKDEFEMELEKIEPMIAKPYSPANVVAVDELEGMEIDQVFIGSCTNGRLEDLAVAAKILKGKKVADGTRCIAIAASRNVYTEALKKGYVETLTEAGCLVTFGTCGPCVGAHYGVLGPGEVALFTTNRNFRGRSGHRDSKVYLVSPATAAASAIEGKVVNPRKYLNQRIRDIEI